MPLEVLADRYEVLRRLGQGGMGDVCLAQDTLLGRDVAVKFVSDRALRETPGSADILRDEAKTAGSLLGHPQIVSVLDLLHVSTDLHEGPAIVMEYVAGCNLAEWITVHQNKLDVRTRQQVGLYIAQEIIEGVSFAHKKDVLHRDLKPHNILVSLEGRIKVTDFGLARVVDAVTRSHTLWWARTPLYAAPEQWRDEKPDEKTDVYQLCASLYHLFAGRPAAEGRSPMALMRWHERGSVRSLDTGEGESLDERVARLIVQGLSKRRTDRPDLWAIFDAVSDQLPGHVNVEVDVTDCEPEAVEEIVRLTDLDRDELKKGKVAFEWPNPLEPLREAIGVVLNGGMCRILPSSPPVAESSSSGGSTDVGGPEGEPPSVVAE
ncbi:serine/threonine-protein kinase [Blastococcus goldschmidtiae]|uniref:Serine/threonine-protein kinase n=1 Tax=Blastococcus goldschmidtiae TaxID=3075546 RepID=A0ABU2KBI6_9ACTN|nr:serine/threonine-protein kinase [Blastococcus sp. DSM 46792]MDT0277551.1 serine/threonine-protein kinase [Blastococcus sp. DSM 46792]